MVPVGAVVAVGAAIAVGTAGAADAAGVMGATGIEGIDVAVTITPFSRACCGMGLDIDEYTLERGESRVCWSIAWEWAKDWLCARNFTWACACA